MRLLLVQKRNIQIYSLLHLSNEKIKHIFENETKWQNI